MNEPWQIRVYEQQHLVYTAELTGAAELGRQSDADEALYSCKQVSGRWRVVIASKDEKFISRQHVLLEPLDEKGFRITNVSARLPIRFPDGTALKPNASCAISADTLLAIGGKAVRLQGKETAVQESVVLGLVDVTALPGRASSRAVPFAGPPLGTIMVGGGGDHKDLLRWLQTVMDVFQVAASSAEFFEMAARAVVEMVNLDSGRILLLKQGDWRVQTLQTAPRIVPESNWRPSRRVLDRVVQEKRTFWEVPNTVGSNAASLMEVDAIVVAPILDRSGEVIGALYGDRHQKTASATSFTITELEAMLVELLARGVAGGLVRLDQEQAALAARVQFEQFFTPELARHLAKQPDLLKGRDVEVTVLFCDIRAFSRISERLGPASTVEWIGSVMGTLSDCVRAHSGVLVDYIGDELIAMWGAPEEQPAHARLACRAALDMLEALPRLNEQWQATLQEPMSFGIGLNTGVARVGNTGSHHKFKYGPLGNTVNLASRVQGATKHLKCRLLITAATQRQLDDSFSTRRLCRVRVVNIGEPVDLYEMVLPGQAGWPDAKVEYERALEEFEKQNFRTSARILGNWRAQQADDGPALLLLYRAVQCMVEEPTAFDPVWVLQGK